MSLDLPRFVEDDSLDGLHDQMRRVLEFARAPLSMAVASLRLYDRWGSGVWPIGKAYQSADGRRRVRHRVSRVSVARHQAELKDLLLRLTFNGAFGQRPLMQYVRPAIAELQERLDNLGGRIPRLAYAPGHLRDDRRGLLAWQPAGAVDREYEFDHYYTVACYLASALELRLCPKCLHPFVPHSGKKGPPRKYCSPDCQRLYNESKPERKKAKAELAKARRHVWVRNKERAERARRRRVSRKVTSRATISRI